MNFKYFFEQQAGYDIPFDQEFEVLRKLQSADPITQAQLDVNLHNNAVNKQRFSPQDKSILQQDKPLKQKVAQAFSGEITNSNEIQQIIQQLHKDQKTHLDYLRQTPNENTGSHIWHKTWAQIYQNWIDLLRKGPLQYA